MTILMITCALIFGAALGWTAAAAWYSKKLKKQEMLHALELSESFLGYDDSDSPDGLMPLNEREQEIHDQMFGKP